MDPSQQPDVQDLLYFGEGRPLLFRLHLSADGRPFDAGWTEYVHRLFRFLDRDGDGVLDRNEAGHAPADQVVLQHLQGGSSAAPNGNVPFGELDRDQDGKVSRDEFTHYYRRSRAGPVLLVPYAGQAGPDFLTEALFSALDRDRDGKLTKEELTAAPALLGRFDQDDDELLSAQELLPNPVPTEYQRLLSSRRWPGLPLLLVGREEAGNRLTQRLSVAKQVLARYDRDGSRKLSRAEISLLDEFFKRLDTNQDGELDSVELLRWLIVTPDVEVVLRLGRTPEKVTPVEIVPSPRGPVLPVAVESARVLSLSVESSRISLICARGAAVNSDADSARQVFLQQLRRADRNGKGFVTRKQVEGPRLAFLRSLFPLVDRDENGRLTEAELLAWADLVSGAGGRLTRVAFTDQGRGLFALLDADQDGRLSVRELRNVWARLAEHDRNGDGGVTREELPAHYRILVYQGQFPGGPTPTGISSAGGGPLWFRKMDRNGDGDVSRREFLGPADDFRRLDADGDGLISAAEAERANAGLRRRSTPRQ